MRSLTEKAEGLSKKLPWVAVALFLLVSLGCGGGEVPAEAPEETPAADTGGAVWQPAGDEGTVIGKVSFEGDAPKLRPISMDADEVCASQHSGSVYAENVVTNENGTLRKVFIHVKSGLEDKTFAVPGQPVVLDQVGCIYKPHVVGIQARQNLEVRNSDNTAHNIHPIPKVNREWNVSQPPGADPIVKALSRPESSVPVKCNQHPWMRAYIHVVKHPFHGVTGEDGSFELKGLPPTDRQRLSSPSATRRRTGRVLWRCCRRLRSTAVAGTRARRS